jgi:hypothetical protein
MNTYQSVLNLVEMPYHWGTMINGQWQKMGTIVITHQGVLLDQEKLANPRFHPSSCSLIFGGSYRSYARAGRLTFDPTQLYFHGTMEQNDGNMAQIIGFADYSWTFGSMIKPVRDPNAPGKKGPVLKITIDRTAFDGILDTNPVQVSLNENGTAVDVTNRVTSHNLNKVKHTFEMTMGQGGPFPPTTNLFDVKMATDFSQFDGTYDFNSQASTKFLWSGRADQASMTTLKVAIQEAKNKLKKALVPKMEYAEPATNSHVHDASSTMSDTSEAAILPGLDAEDIAFLAKMKAKGMNIAALDNIRAISIGTDKDGKSKVIDPAQELTAKMMNMASVKTLTEPWVTDFGIKAEPILPKAETVRQNNLEFFGKNAELQMANVLKYKQDNFTGVNETAIKNISKKKLEEAWSFKSMTPKRASGYIKASTELYGVAYEQINEEFAFTPPVRKNNGDAPIFTG